MPDRPVLRSLAWGAAGAGIFWGCTLDWNVRLDDPADGAPTGESSLPESAADGTDPASEGGPNEAGPPDADLCDALRIGVGEKEVEARRCSLGATGQCGEQEMSLCCKVWVAKRDAAATETFRQAVDGFKQASCAMDCSKVTCSVTTISSCVQEPSTATLCSP